MGVGGGSRTRLNTSSASGRQHHLPNTSSDNVVCHWGSSCRGRASSAYVPMPSLPDAVVARDHPSAIQQSHLDLSTHQDQYSNYVCYIALPCGSDAMDEGGEPYKDMKEVMLPMVWCVVLHATTSTTTWGLAWRKLSTRGPRVRITSVLFGTVPP